MKRTESTLAAKPRRRRKAAWAGADPFYIAAAAGPGPRRVLKHGETFAVLDRQGDVRPEGLGEEGVYYQGTRFLSTLELRVGSERPLLLNSSAPDDNTRIAVDLTNPDARDSQGAIVLARGSVHLLRSVVLWQNTCHQRVRVRSYSPEPVRIDLSFRFAADYADIFEVRGTRRTRRGSCLSPEVGGDRLELGYRGLDGEVRRTRLEFSPAPDRLADDEADYRLTLPPHGEASVSISVCCETGARHVASPGYERAAELIAAEFRPRFDASVRLETSHQPLNEWLHRSQADLTMMVTRGEHGPYPDAGVPWLSAPFGRDGIITAMERLWLEPELARGVLSHLAATQTSTTNEEQDAEPGKILHEARHGEMAALGETPFGSYYGSADATPLFVMLAAAYYRRTNDLVFIRAIWPNLERAMQWIRTSGDPDGDGFVECARHSSSGLVHQGWKNSPDAVFHADGSDAAAPLALVEVQAYAYAARRGFARLALAVGESEQAEGWVEEARVLQERFERHFWQADLGTYAVALDGAKEPCRVRASNAGHALWTGIAAPDHGRQAAAALLGADLFSGWGIRTLARTESRFNPMSYHNGSVWPHDTALAAAGMARYGMTRSTLALFEALLDASSFFELARMPELFCGFERRPGEGPTSYPVACAPQSCAAGSVFLLLASCLGLSIDAPRRQLRLDNPHLPARVEEISIRNLRVGPAMVDLRIYRHGDDASVYVSRREGDLEVIAVK